MAESDPISSLFNLSLAALIDHVKEKKVKISPDQIPTNIHKHLWNNSTVLDLVINTCHPETRHWFSTRVIKPPVLTVDFKSGFFDTCLVTISFENRQTVSWTLVPSNWPESPNPKFIIRTGNQYITTQRKNNSAGYISRLTNYDRTRLEVINWLCKAFRCEISELEMDYDHQMLNWPKLKLANTLKIRRINKLEVLEKLIIARQKNNLRTTLDELIFEKPIEKKLLQHIDFKHARVNLSDRTVDQLIEEFRDLSQRAHGIVIARTMKLSIEDFESFKAILYFDNRITTSAKNRRITKKKLRLVPEFRHTRGLNLKFCSFQDDKVTLFKFMWTKPGTYNRIIMSIY